MTSESRRDIYTSVFIEILFTITQKWKQPKFPLLSEQSEKTQHIDTNGDYSDIKIKEILK